MPGIAPARLAAFRTLEQVGAGAHSDAAIHEAAAGLDTRDAALAAELVMGVLRFRAQLDYVIATASGRPLAKLDAAVVDSLRLGVYQIRHLDRIPSHAAVSDSVELVRRARKASAAGFVNAVLRKVRREPVEWPDRSTALSCPEWLLERWGDRAETIAQHALTTPPSGMDEGARAIVPLLELREGMRFADLCAAPGNKTRLVLAEQPSFAVACDRSMRRLAATNVACPRVLLDAASPLPFRAAFDRILLDAPCSGTGTLARNPEIKWRIAPEDFARHAARQRAMIAEALNALQPGGRLVYATCSLEPEEDEDAVAGFPVIATMRRWPGVDPGDGFFAAVIARD